MGGTAYRCGDSEPWDPDQKGLFVPLSWVRQLEDLWRQHIRRPMLVVSQGGLAPVAVRLAAREADSWIGSCAVAGLVLASPPEWRDMAGGYDRIEARLAPSDPARGPHRPRPR